MKKGVGVSPALFLDQGGLSSISRFVLMARITAENASVRELVPVVTARLGYFSSEKVGPRMGIRPLGLHSPVHPDRGIEKGVQENP